MGMYSVSKLNKRSGKYRSNWQETYKKDLSLLGAECEICKSKRNLDRHHIINKSKAGPDIPLNLQILCHSCHMRKHGKK